MFIRNLYIYINIAAINYIYKKYNKMYYYYYY